MYTVFICTIINSKKVHIIKPVITVPPDQIQSSHIVKYGMIIRLDYKTSYTRLINKRVPPSILIFHQREIGISLGFPDIRLTIYHTRS
jgi:hypothetical protein